MRAGKGDAGMAALVEAIGETAARELARRFGGTSVYVPRMIGDDHALCKAVGRGAADKLAAWAGSSAINVPKQPERRARVLELYRSGTRTIREIALDTNYSERQIYRLLSKVGDERQPDLFG